MRLQQVGDKAVSNCTTTTSAPSSARRAGKRASSTSWATRLGTTTTTPLPTASKGATLVPHAYLYRTDSVRRLRRRATVVLHPRGSSRRGCGRRRQRGRDGVLPMCFANRQHYADTLVHVHSQLGKGYVPHDQTTHLNSPLHSPPYERYVVLLGYTERWHYSRWTVTYSQSCCCLIYCQRFLARMRSAVVLVVCHR